MAQAGSKGWLAPCGVIASVVLLRVARIRGAGRILDEM